MIRYWTIYVFQFVFLILFQGLILNNIEINGYINPYIYILLIIGLPYNLPKHIVLTIAFFTGLLVDLFTNTIGVHASASVFIGFLRPYIFKLIEPREGYEDNKRPSVINMGWKWFLSYCAIAVLIHHLFLFYVEAFSFKNFFLTFSRVILSAFFSIICIIIAQLFTVPPNSKN